ncbi:MAG: hypothetical protein ACYS0D_01905 [Planctomycetota bacterium]|jgi:hypothetical protein
MSTLFGPCLCLLAAATAQNGPEPDAAGIPSVPDLQVDVLAGAWLARLGGDASLGAGGADIDLATQFDLDDMEPSLNLELAIRSRDKWLLTFGGTDFESSVSGRFAGNADFGSISLADGDLFSSSFEISTVFADLAVGVWRPFTSSPERIAELDNRSDSNRILANLRISPLVGGRFVDVDHTVSASGAREDAGGEWLALYAGLQLTIDYRPEITLLDRLRLQATLGLGPALADETGWAWQVRAGMSLHVTENFGVLIGYRLLELDVENEGYTLKGGLQGLFLGGSLRF